MADKRALAALSRLLDSMNAVAFEASSGKPDHRYMHRHAAYLIDALAATSDETPAVFSMELDGTHTLEIQLVLKPKEENNNGHH